MGLIKRRLILFRVFIKTHYKEKIFEPHLDLRRSAAPDCIRSRSLSVYVYKAFVISQ